MDPNMLQSMSTLGMIQKISTGNMYVDIVICMLLPVLLSRFSPYFEQWWAWLNQTAETHRFSRAIKFIKREGYYHYDPSESNHILQEAVMLYIGSRPDLTQKFKTADIKLYKTDRFKPYYDDEDDEYEDSDDDDMCNMAKELRSFKINTQPAVNEFIEVADGVLFRKSEVVEERGNDGSSRDRNVTFELKSDAKDGHRRIQAFMDTAFEYYTQLQSGKKDKARYLFMPTKQATKQSEDCESQNNMVYKRYKLSNEKTFDCFFHDQKDALLNLVDHFLAKTGKFSIQGYPNKLGILLHGPPGTGKTSLIKALAHYTKRSIVSVPLNKVKTNQELMDIMFDQSFLVQGEELPMKLPHNKVMFVMEDVDAAGSVVLRRENNGTSSSPVLDFDALAQALSAHAAKDKSRDSKNGSKDAATDSKDEKAHGPDIPSAYLKGAGFYKDTSDDLNLAGILNVLDGVVDCPDRIVLMTTNHPERLDPALIRPGRINKKIYLGYMNAKQATAMTRHYFRDASEEDFEAFREAVPLEQLSPAKLEAMCAEHDSLKSLVAYLRDEFQMSGLI